MVFEKINRHQKFLPPGAQAASLPRVEARRRRGQPPPVKIELNVYKVRRRFLARLERRAGGSLRSRSKRFLMSVYFSKPAN